MASTAHRRLLLLLLVVVFLGLGLLANATRLGQRHRIEDQAGLIAPSELPNFETYLRRVYDESGVDIRFLFVDSMPGTSLEQFSVRRARELGVGQESDRRGVLFVYDVGRQRLRIEVGSQSEWIFTDRFVGYLMRDQVRSFFAAGDPALGLRLTLFMLHARLRRAALGEEYDPRPTEYIEDRNRLASGGGASTAMPESGARAEFLNARAAEADRAALGPQPTPEGAYGRYLEWLQAGRLPTDVDLFTKPSQDYLARLRITRAFADYLLFLEYNHRYRVLVRGDLGMLYFTDDPLLSPHFFRGTAAGWQMDIAAEVRDTRNYAGGPWTWAMVDTGDDVARTFGDRYIALGSLLRLAGGDNRPLPTRAWAIPRSATRPPLANAVEHLTVTEAAARIAQTTTRPSVVILYTTWDERTRKMFPAIARFAGRCRGQGVEVLAFSIDENLTALDQLAGFLVTQGAPFPAIHLYRWPSGQLTGVMAPLGIDIGAQWMPPFFAVRDRAGRVIAQADDVTDLASSGIETGVRQAVGSADAKTRATGAQKVP